MELLVHIGAPTTRIDDERYKVQAAAYANFEPSASVVVNEYEEIASGSSDLRLADEHIASSDKEPHGSILSSLGSEHSPNDPRCAAGFPDERPGATADLSQDSVHTPDRLALPPSSALQRLEILQQAWRSRPRVSARGLETSRPSFLEQGSGWRYDTQLAASILESQLVMKQSVGKTRSSNSDDTSGLGSPVKRRKTQAFGASDVELGPFLAPCSQPAVGASTALGGSARQEVPRTLHPSPETPEPDSLTSLLPSLYSISDTTTDASAKRSQGPQPPTLASARTRQPLQAIRPNASSPKAAVEEMSMHHPTSAGITSIPANPTKHVATKHQLQAHLLPSSSNERPPTQQTATEQKAEANALLSTLPIEAHPPRSTTATPFPTTHITRKLATLISIPQLAARYKRLALSRPIAPNERGRWEFTVQPGDEVLQSWGVEQQAAFWDSLCVLVRDGSLGGCLWCVRRPPSSRGGGGAAGGRGAGVAGQSDGETLGRVRVFCWGEVVQHVWLLLYTLSNSRIRKVRSEWVDSQGEVVVQIGG